jgi:hypothetical protein
MVVLRMDSVASAMIGFADGDVDLKLRIDLFVALNP